MRAIQPPPQAAPAYEQYDDPYGEKDSYQGLPCLVQLSTAPYAVLVVSDPRCANQLYNMLANDPSVSEVQAQGSEFEFICAEDLIPTLLHSLLSQGIVIRSLNQAPAEAPQDDQYWQ